MDYDDYDQYNGDAEHDMWVDFNDYMYTGKPAEYFNDNSDLAEDDFDEDSEYIDDDCNLSED